MRVLSRRSCLCAMGALFSNLVLAEPPDETLAYERETGGRIGYFAQNVKTGRMLAWRPDERFIMCSTFKLSLAACVLRRVDRGEERLDRPIPYDAKDLFDYAPTARANVARGSLSVEQMCQAAVELSDNTCANLLLNGIGGPSAMTDFWRSIGDTITRLDHYELELNRSIPGSVADTTTPAAMAGNLRRLLLGEVLSSTARTRLTQWMVDCQTGANRLRAGLPAKWKIADKTGNNGEDAAGDLAITWPSSERPILIAAYVQGGKPTPEQVTGVFSALGRRFGRELG